MWKSKEKDWENHLTKKLQGWGWQKIPTIARENYSEIIDKEILAKQLQLINTQLKTEQREKIIKEIINIPIFFSNIETANYDFHHKLNKGIEIFDSETQTYQKFTLISKDYSQNNYSFIQQFEVENPTNKKRIRLDLILFINGLPISIIEVKNWTDESSFLEKKQLQSFDQLKRYEKTVPHLFSYLNFVTFSITPEIFYYGVSGESYQEDGYFLWHDREENYLFESHNFLNILLNFTLYDERKRKIIIRYYQLATIKKINFQSEKGVVIEKKAGVIKHATGTGKSYLTIFLINYFRQHLTDYSFLLVVDRKNLNKQFSDKFTNFASFAEFNLEMVENSQQLLTTITKSAISKFIYFTTIQKFYTAKNQLPSDKKFVVIVDEAHRSNYGEFAQTMRHLLPQAVFLGLTGTPIDKLEKSTLNVFGDIVYFYSTNQSIRDGFNVPLIYKLIKKYALLEENASLKKKYQEIIKVNQDKEEEEVKKNLNEAINLETLLSHPQRVNWIVEKFFQIYREISEESSGVAKTMFIAYSRKMAIDIYKRIKQVNPFVVLIISPQPKDEEEIKEMLTKREENIEVFRKENDNTYQIAIVVDMLCTGFDMPCLKAIFLDTVKSEEHDIFQTITRVNRTFWDKRYGLVVDFLGIKESVVNAVKKYEAEEAVFYEWNIQEDIHEKIEKLRTIYHELNSHFNSLLEKNEQTEILLIKIVEQLINNKKHLDNFLLTCQELEKYKFFWKTDEKLSDRQKIFLQNSLEIAQIVREKEKTTDNFTGARRKNFDKSANIQKKIWEFIQIKPGNSHEGEEELTLQLLGSSIEEINNIKRKWEAEKISQEIRKKMNLLNSWDYEEFAQKLTKLISQYNNLKTSEYIKSLSILEKEIEKKIKRRKENPQKDFFISLLQFLRQKFPRQEEKINQTVREIIRQSEQERKKVDWNKRYPITQEIKKQIKIVLYQNFPQEAQIKEITEELFSVLESEEEIIQNFNREHEKIFS